MLGDAQSDVTFVQIAPSKEFESVSIEPLSRKANVMAVGWLHAKPPVDDGIVIRERNAPDQSIGSIVKV